MPLDARSTRQGMSASVITVIFRSFSIKERRYGGQISANVFIDDSMLAWRWCRTHGDSICGPSQADHDHVAWSPVLERQGLRVLVWWPRAVSPVWGFP